MHLEPLYQQTICFGHKEIHTTTHSSPFDVSKMGIPTWIQTPLLQYFSDTPNFVMFEEAGSINRTVLRLRGEHSLLKTIEVKKCFHYFLFLHRFQANLSCFSLSQIAYKLWGFLLMSHYRFLPTTLFRW